MARISCSVRARLIFFRSIISAFERTGGGCEKEPGNKQKGGCQNVTFHCEKLPRLLFPNEIYFPNVTTAEHFDLLEARRVYLHGSHLDRMAGVRPPESHPRGRLMSQIGACQPLLALCRTENKTSPSAVRPSRLWPCSADRPVLHWRVMV